MIASLIRYELVSILLEHGARAGEIAPSGTTALHCAARAGPKRLVTHLIEAKADPLRAHTTEGTLPVEMVNWRLAVGTSEASAVHEVLCSASLAKAECSGFLTKLGGERLSWKRRFCLVPTAKSDELQLRYYSDEKLTSLYGAIDLRQLLPSAIRTPSHSEVVARGRPADVPRSFDIIASGRVYVFKADSKAMCDHWVARLQIFLGHAAAVAFDAMSVSEASTPSRAHGRRPEPFDSVSSSVSSTSRATGSSSAVSSASLRSHAASAAASASGGAGPSASFTRQGGLKEGGRSLMRKIFNRVADTEPVQEGQHTSHGVTAVGSDEVEADADEGAHSTSLTLFVGEAAAQATSGDAQATVGQAAGEAGLLCFDPLEGLRVHALHTSLHLLQPIATTKMKRGAKRGSALGVVVEVALLNGVRTMSIRSTVSLLNGTEVPVEMSAPQPQSAALAELSTHCVAPHCAQAVPLLLTSRGAEAAIWSIRLRPLPGGPGGSEVHAATLLPPTLFSRDMSVTSVDDALLVCPPIERTGSPWAACVVIGYEYESVGTHRADAPGARKGAGGGAGGGVVKRGKTGSAGSRGRGADGRLRQQSIEIVRRFRLPATELLLHQWSCVVPIVGGSQRGKLCLSTHFFCWYTLHGVSHDGVLLASKVSRVAAQSGVLNGSDGLELHLEPLGVRLAFSGFEYRDDALRQIQAWHARTREGLSTEGAAAWLPHSLRLVPPMSVSNLLPCALRLTIRALPLSSAKANELGWPVLPSVMYGDASAEAGAPGGPRPVEMCLEPGKSACSHDVCVLGPIEIALEIGAADETCSGVLQLARPHDRLKEGHVVTLSSSKTRLAGGQTLRLQCRLKPTSRAGSVELAVYTLHAILNRSSLPLRLYDTALRADPSPVVEAPATALEGIPFSLEEGRVFDTALAAARGRSGGSCRIGVGSDTDVITGMVDYTERISDGRLSKAFSISVTGNEGELEVSTGKGQRAELVVSVNAAKGAAAALGTCVVEVHDRFMIHNRTLQHIELMQWAGDASSTAAEIKQAITGAAREAREAMREKLGFVKSDSQALAASVYELPPGGQAPIKWHSGDEGRRFVALRSSKGFRAYDWCEPFSPVSTGEIILKCRALNDATGASGGSARQDGGAPLYLRLNVSMIGPRRVLVLRPALNVQGQLRLPYRVTNRTTYLLAFCQRGSEQLQEHWDLLGAGEACEYTWDRPGGERCLSVLARDAAGAWHGEASASPVATCAPYSIEKISEKLAPLKIIKSRAHGGADAVARTKSYGAAQHGATGVESEGSAVMGSAGAAADRVLVSAGAAAGSVLGDARAAAGSVLGSAKAAAGNVLDSGMGAAGSVLERAGSAAGSVLGREGSAKEALFTPKEALFTPSDKPPPVERRQSAKELLAATSPPPDETVLLSASCLLWAGGQCWAKGWLCVTQSSLTFLAFSEAQMAAALAANSVAAKAAHEGPGSSGSSKKVSAADATGAEAPVPISALPLPLGSILSISSGVRPGQLLIKVRAQNGAPVGTSNEGGGVDEEGGGAGEVGGAGVGVGVGGGSTVEVEQAIVLGSLRTAQKTLQRLLALIGSHRAAQSAVAAMARVRVQMASAARDRLAHGIKGVLQKVKSRAREEGVVAGVSAPTVPISAPTPSEVRHKEERAPTTTRADRRAGVVVAGAGLDVCNGFYRYVPERARSAVLKALASGKPLFRNADGACIHWSDTDWTRKKGYPAGVGCWGVGYADHHRYMARGDTPLPPESGWVVRYGTAASGPLGVAPAPTLDLARMVELRLAWANGRADSLIQAQTDEGCARCTSKRP